MSSPSILKKLGDKAKGYVKMAKTLPLDDSTTAGLRAVGENVSGRALAKEPAKDTSTTPSDMLHPVAQYGSRQGEVRLDSEGNPTKMQPPKVMDAGGDIDDSPIPMPASTGAINAAAAVGKSAPAGSPPSKPAAKSSADVLSESQGALNNIPQVTGNAAPAMPTMGMPTSASLPALDNGGDIPVADQGIDVNDGQHEVAILKHGEKVLNPEEADAYRAGQMKPLGQPAPKMRTMAEGGDVPVNPVEPVMPRRASVRETIDSPETLRGISSMYREAQPSFARQTGPTRMPEILEPISNSGKLGPTTEGDRNIMPDGGMRTIAAVPNDSLGVVHSHPYGEAPQPSDQDYEVAKKLNRPNYELSSGELYTAEPNGNRNKPTKVADLDYRKGKLNYKWAPVDVPKPEKFSGYMPMKKYDQGGDVTATHNGKDVPLPEHAKDTVYETEHVPMGKPSSSLPPMETEIKPTPKAPLVYDQGGDVKSEKIPPGATFGKPVGGIALPSRYQFVPNTIAEDVQQQKRADERAHPERGVDLSDDYQMQGQPAPTHGARSHMIYGDEVPAGGTLPVPKELQGKPEPVPAGPSAEDIMRQQVARRRAYQQLETNPIPTLDRGGDIGMRQLGSEYPVLPTPEGKGNNILENLQNFDQGGDVGAPADFGGRVLPNPQGVRPMLDTEIPPRETERISGGAKMNTDNAPLTNPKGDTSNPAKTQALPPDPAIVEAGQREMGTHPSQQPQPAQPAPEVKGTDAERKAIAVDKQKAMGKGVNGLVDLGTALLNERHLSPMKPMTGEPKVYDDGGDVQVEDKDKTPPEFNQGYRPMVVDTGKPAVQAAPQHGVEDTGQLTPEQFNQGRNKGAALPSGATEGVTAPAALARPAQAPGMKSMMAPEAPAAPAGGMKQMSTATQPQGMYQATPGGALRPGTEPAGQGETQGEQRDLAKMDHQAKIKDYDQKIQAALDSATPEGKELADRLSYAKQSYIQHSPWGSEGNHPGVLGKIAHGLARTGEIAADIAAPGLTKAIPGTPERMAREQAGTQATLEKDVASEVALDKPDKSKQYEFKESTDDKGNPVWIGINKTNPADVVQTHNPAFVKDAEGKPTDQTTFMNQWYKDNPTAPKSAENDKKAIQEYKSAEATPATVMVPTGQPGVSQAVQLKPGETYSDAISKPGALQSQEAGVEKVFKGKTLVQTNADGSRTPVTYDQAKANNFEGVAPLTAAQEEKERKKSDTYVAATNGIDEYEKDKAEANLTDADQKAMGTLLAASDEHSDMVTNFANAITSAIAGEPLTEYQKKVQNATMTADQYKAMSPAGRKVLADYYNTMFLHFANVKETQGGMPRNPRMIAFEIGSIPLPYISAKEAQPTFDVLRERLGIQNRSNIPFNKPKENAAGVTEGGGIQPPKEADAGMKWQHRTINGKTDWRQVAANQ